MDSRLKPKISCEAVCEDEYQVENLVLPVPREFIAYSALRPPVSINVHLVCRIYVSCIKVWAKVGSLKSTAFELSAEGQILAYGKCEQDSQIGVFFYTAKSPKTSVAHFTPILIKNCRKPVSNLKITVKRTRSCAPVIKRLEIWGQPAEKCHEVENLASSSRSNVHHFETLEDSPPQEPLGTDLEGTPEEFLDSLTYHIMTIPFTLPSGKVIDERTLNRCCEIEGEWDRPPCDPFTGLEFTRARRPVFNHALKARIDKFLLANNKESPERTVVTSYLRRASESPPKPSGSAAQPRKASPTGAASRCCQQCERTEHLYEVVKCKHLICRNCLYGSKEVRTSCTIANCSVSFSRTEVVKFYVNR